MSVRSAKLDATAATLRTYVSQFGPGEKVTSIHLFGIENGSSLDDLTVAECKQVAARAELKESLGTELHKGIRLAKYAVRRPT